MRLDHAALTQGRWRSILPALGVDAKYLANRHGPCPICNAGRDRFRFDDRHGNGSWICSVCGAGDGFSLLMQVKGIDFSAARQMVLDELGAGEHERQLPRSDVISPEEARRLKGALWKQCKRPGQFDAVMSYLRQRGLHFDDIPHDLFIVDECDVSGVPGIRAMTAMVALLRKPDGSNDTLHRTYLQQPYKAKIDRPRRMMPGQVTTGSAVRLWPMEEGKPLGVAEGVETALAAQKLFDVPVWATTSTSIMKKWEAPEGPSEIIVYGDHDLKYGGHAAAYALAHRLACQQVNVRVEMPAEPGTDWCDVLNKQRAAA